MDPVDPVSGERFRRRRCFCKPSVSEPPSSAPDMSEAEEGDPERDGDGGSRRPAAGVVERAASSAAVGRAATRAAVEVSASKTAAGEAAASEDLEEASATAADGVATTAATEGASKTPHEGVAARAAVGRAAALAAVEGVAGASAANGEGPQQWRWREQVDCRPWNSRGKNQPQEPGRRPCKKGLCDQCRRT